MLRGGGCLTRSARISREMLRVLRPGFEHGDDDRVLAIVTDRKQAILMLNAHVGEIRNAHRLVVLRGDDEIFDLSCGFNLRIDDELEGKGRALDTANRFQTIELADLICQIGGRQTGGEQIVRASLDLDLAEIAAGHIGIQDIRYVLDPRCELVKGVITQLRGLSRR